MIAPAQPTDAGVQRDFQALLPELTSRLSFRFYSNGPDLQAEYTAEAVALSWQMYRSARNRERKPSVANLAWFAVRQVVAGRRLAGSTSLDAFSDTPLARQRIGRHVGLADVKSDPQESFYRTFGDRRWRWPMIDVVGTKLDWTDFLAACSQRDRRIVEMKLQGHAQTEVAVALGISPPAVCQRLRALRQRWEAQALA